MSEAAQLRHARLKEVRTRIVDSWLFAPRSTTTRLAIDSEESFLSRGSLVTGDSGRDSERYRYKSSHTGGTTRLEGAAIARAAAADTTA